jgi:DNA polymerase V
VELSGYPLYTYTKMKIIPIKVQAGMTGFESCASEYQTLPMSLDEILIDNQTSCYLGLAVGDSMQDHGIHDGDLLIVDRAAAKTNLDIVVLTLNGVFMVKLYDRKGQQLLSGNVLNKTYHLSEDDDFIVEGIVIRSVRMIRKSSKLAEHIF